MVQDTDRYGRTVGRVYVGNLDVNAEMIRQGAAWVYRDYAKDPSLYRLEERAKAPPNAACGRCPKRSGARPGTGGRGRARPHRPRPAARRLPRPRPPSAAASPAPASGIAGKWRAARRRGFTSPAAASRRLTATATGRPARRCAGNRDARHAEPSPRSRPVGRAVRRGRKPGAAVYRHSFSNRAGLAAV